jgi:NlpC/P60 family putative phage cell wall peptidase
MTIASEVVAEARRWVGTPYRHGSSTRGVGCDCLGLVRGIWRVLYGGEPEHVPVYSADWAEVGHGDLLVQAARRHMVAKNMGEMTDGDLVIFRWRDGVAAKHLGIVSAADRFIHAYEGHRVMEPALVPQWRKRIAAVFAFPERN